MRCLPTNLAAHTILLSICILCYWHREIGVHAECTTHLPIATSSSKSLQFSTSVRIVDGIRAPSSFLRNVVTIAYDTDSSKTSISSSRQTDTTDDDASTASRDYSCMGTLISPLWVLTAAHCFVSPSRNYVLHGTGGHSLAGRERRINRVITHPKWDEQSSSTLNDIQLIELEPSSSLNLSQFWQYMHINSNTSFTYNNQRNAYLRVKGFGILELPQNNDVPIQGLARQLTYADLPLVKCSAETPRPMLCTRSVDGCGPCHGDVGAPLYTVDKSAQIEVQVGILQLRPYAATNYSECLSTVSSTSEDRDVLDTLYTPLAPYVSWISSYVPEIRDRLISVPTGGLSSTNFSTFYNETATTTPLPTPEPQYKVNVTVAVSIVGAVTFVLLIAVIYLVIRACIRRSKRREIEEYAENSFIDPGGRFADRNKDPFAAIPSNTRLASAPRTNLASQPESLWHRLMHVFGGKEGDVSDDQRGRPVDSADLKGMNSFSTVSWDFGRNDTAGANGDVDREGRGRQSMGTVRDEHPVRGGQQAQQSSVTNSGNGNEVTKSETHDIDDPPSWLHAAWERLRVFRPMSPSSSGNLNLNGSGRLRRETTNRGECLVEFEMEHPVRPLESSSTRLFHDHPRPSSGEVRATTDVPDEVGASVMNNNNDARMPPAALDCMVEVEMERPR